MKKLLAWALLCTLILAVFAAHGMATDKKLKIGFSESEYNGAWRVAEVEDMKKYAEIYGYELIITNASSDIEKQIADVEDLIAQKCDLIIIVPIDANAVAPAFDACKAANIPVIDLDTEYLDGVWGEDFITVVRSDQYEQGKACAQWVLDTFEGQPVKVLEITGTPGRSDAQKRSAGFNETVLAARDDVTVITQNGDWDRANAQEIALNVAQSADGDFNVLYAHCDEMALGALLGIKQAGLAPNQDVWIVSVDGQFEALDAVMANELGAVVTCTPKGGDIVFSIIQKYFDGEELENTYLVHQSVITLENVEELYHIEGF